MLINRDISRRIEVLASQFPAVVITGARQVGKTSIARELFPNHSYVTLDDFSIADLAESNPTEFLDRHPAPLIIDEIQYAPNLFRYIKIDIDRNRQESGRYILTGSQKFTLMKGVSESLAGRAGIVNLEGLSASEIGQVIPKITGLGSEYELFIRGSFPELWNSQSRSVVDYYSSYLQTYIERDVRQIVNVGSSRDFERFIRGCASRNSGLLNKSDLARDLGISVATVNSWLSIVEASNQVSFLEPYYTNKSKALAKSPKLYLNDVGMLSHLLQLDVSNLQASTLFGGVAEAFVFSELRKLKNSYFPGAEIMLYRDNQRREIDFIFSEKAEVATIEVKTTERPDIGKLTTLHMAESLIDRKIKAKIVVCGAKEAYQIGEIIVLPFAKFGEHLRKLYQREVSY